MQSNKDENQIDLFDNINDDIRSPDKADDKQEEPETCKRYYACNNKLPVPKESIDKKEGQLPYCKECYDKLLFLLKTIELINENVNTDIRQKDFILFFYSEINPRLRKRHQFVRQ